MQLSLLWAHIYPCFGRALGPLGPSGPNDAGAVSAVGVLLATITACGGALGAP